MKNQVLNTVLFVLLVSLIFSLPVEAGKQKKRKNKPAATRKSRQDKTARKRTSQKSPPKSNKSKESEVNSDSKPKISGEWMVKLPEDFKKAEEVEPELTEQEKDDSEDQEMLGSRPKLLLTVAILKEQGLGPAPRLNPIVNQRLKQLERELGFSIPKGSAHRTIAKQKLLKFGNGKCGKRSRGKRGRRRGRCIPPNPNAAPVELATHTYGVARDIPYRRMPQTNFERLKDKLEEWDNKGWTITTLEYRAQKCLHVVFLPKAVIWKPRLAEEVAKAKSGETESVKRVDNK